MVDVEELVSKSKSKWLHAEEAVIGDRLKIIGSGKIDKERFNKPYLVLPVRLLRTNEEKMLRLGPRNIARLVQSWGTTETSEWVGRIVEVVSIEDYPKFNKKGLILRGLPETHQPNLQLGKKDS